MRTRLAEALKEPDSKKRKGIPLKAMIQEEKRRQKEREKQINEEYVFWEFVFGSMFDLDSAGDR